MPAGTYVTVAASAAFVLRVHSRVLTGQSPVNEGEGVVETVITEAEGAPNQLVFTIEDTAAALTFLGGEVVELVDRRSGSERILFGGHLVEWASEQRGSGQGRMLTCQASGYDAWLDWRVIPSFKSWTNKNGRVHQIETDRNMIQRLVEVAKATFIETPGSTVDQTDTTMPRMSFHDVTLREAIQRVADAAADTLASPDPRSFYIDNALRLHYYDGSEGLTAPYRIADGHYTRDVIEASGLVALWPMREATGAPAYDATAYANGTMTGGYTRNIVGLIPNEPHLAATTLNGSTGYMSATGANLHPGDTFSVEYVVRRGSTGSAQTVWSGGTDDVEIGFDASDHLIVYKEGTGNHFVSDATYTSTTAALHVMVTRSPADTDVYVNGAAVAGTTTARTFTAGSGTINVGRRKSSTDRYLTGTVQHVAIYSTKKSAATALAHYQQSVSITPESLRVTRSAFEGREAVWVRGNKAAGTGWVRFAELVNTRFGLANHRERQEVIERDDSETSGQRTRYGRSWLRRNRDPDVAVSLVVVGFDGWRVGQALYVTSDANGLDAYAVEIKQLVTRVGWGNGKLTHEIDGGRLPRSGARIISRRTPRRR